MLKVKLSLPPDSTFLSQLIYESLLYLSGKKLAKFENGELLIESISKALETFDDERVGEIRIVMSGNDNINAKIFETFGIGGVKSRKTYYDLIALLKEHRDKISTKDESEIHLNIKGKDVFMDINSKSDGIAAPQLLKVDRYTGFSSLDTPYTSQQLTFYLSKEVALLALLGIYSSFVTNVRQQQQSYYYFLFFSPEEVAGLLRRTTFNELLLIETTLNLELQRLMETENLDKISLTLFKIAHEGQTYKIYEQIPITVYRNPAFYETAKKYFRDPLKFSERLRRAVTLGVVPSALASLNTKNKYSEADNVLKAIQMLYRFVILGDLQGWFGFLRELSNAHSKLKNSSDGREKNRAGQYLNIVKEVPW
jgi:hypothetical protein